MASWTDEETFKLVEIWGDDRIQAQLEGCKRNKEVYERIAREMAVAGYEKTAEQCREKAKKLKAEYRKLKDKHNKTGQGRKTWKFLEAMDRVLADKPATRPPVLLDTLQEVGPGQESEVEIAVEQEPSLNASCGSSSLGEGDDQQDGRSEGTNTPCATGSRSATPTEKKGKKRNREEKMEKALITVVDRVISAQEASDVKFMALEEKRMRFEERLLEAEERQRREEREFQLRMWTMLMQGMQIPHPAAGMSLGAHLHAGTPHTGPPVPPGPSAPPLVPHLYNTPSPHTYGHPVSYNPTDDEQNL